MPKFTALARERIWWVTSSGGTWNTLEAVRVWKSSPERKACCITSSPEM